MIRYLALALIAGHVSAAIVSATEISDLREWSLVQDPIVDGPAGVLAGSVAMDGTTVTLTATGEIPDFADIGYQSVDGQDVASSTTGFSFSPNEDFQVAIDFMLDFNQSVGGGAIGFGIGEDADGTDSAGAVLTFNDGAPSTALAAARANDIPVLTLPIVPILLLNPIVLPNSGRMFIEYDSASGTVVAGLSTTMGATEPDFTSPIASVQNQWDDEELLVSFFLRSQPFVDGSDPSLTSGGVTATFSNLQDLSIPEPSGAVLLALVSTSALSRRREPAGA